MRRVIATEYVSLDGLMSDPKDEMDGVTDTFNDAMGQENREQQAAADTMLLGRVTYEIFASYWPTATTETEDPATIESMHATPKIVFSRTRHSVEWTNARVVKDGIAAEVRRLKALPGKDMMIIGSASIVQQLLQRGLLDELQLLVHPVVLGRSKPLFAPDEDRHNLKLRQAKTYNNDVLSLHYQAS